MFSPSSTVDGADARHAVEDALSDLAGLDAHSVQRTEMAGHLTGLYRLKAMLDATIVDAVGVFDGRKDWSYDGAFTASGWIAARTDTSRSAASTTVATARQARHMTIAMGQARNGKFTADQLRVLAAARGVSETTAKEYDDDETRLVDAVKKTSIEGAARLMRAWAAAADPDADDDKHSDRDAKRKVNLSTSLEGMGFLDGLLTAEANAVLRAQLEAITDDLHRNGLSKNADGTRLTAAQLRHDALLEMALRPGASATAAAVRRDAKHRAEAEAVEREAAAQEATDKATDGPGEPGDQDRADQGPADPDPADPAAATATDRPGTSAQDPTSDPSPAPDGAGPVGGCAASPAGLDPAGLHEQPGPDGPRSGHDPGPPVPGACSCQNAAQGLLLPPGTGPPEGIGPPGSSQPDDKVAGGLGRPLFTALIDLDTLGGREPTDLLKVRAEVVGVGPLSRDAMARYLCDAGVSRVVTRGASLPLDVGSVSRTATPAQWRALIAHSDTCEFPGCAAPWEWCEAHHLDHWTETHRTALDGLGLGCHGHHTLLHRPGWTMRRNPDLSITVTRPDGTALEPIRR